MELLNTIFYFLIVIGILVFIHEFGHFIAARLSGMRAEIFALGMGPRLFGYNKVTGFNFGKLDESIERGDHTDYRICAFPIGGYVKVSGMIDESMDKNFLGSEPKPWEYRSKPILSRMFVITAGVIMNILLAFAIFYVINIANGKNLTETTTIGYIGKNTPAENSGLAAGDKILSVNGVPVQYWEEVQSQILLENMGEPLAIEVERNGTKQVVAIPKEKVGDITQTGFGIAPSGFTTQVSEVVSGKPAAQCGLQSGDVITEYNGSKIFNQQQLTDLIKSSAGKPSVIKWQREGKEQECNITAGADSVIGVALLGKYTGPVKKIDYNVISALPQAAHDMYYYGVELFFTSIGKIFKGEIAFKKAIGGPVKIAQASAQSAEGGFFTFIGFVALLSISLAVINILPFPALDGGHFMMLLYEAIVRRPIPYKVQVVIQNVGFALLLAFMVFVLYNDIISLK